MDRVLDISVVMSVYNEKEVWLRESIDSILSQTYTNFELIIINDNPNKTSNQVLLSEYIRRDNRVVILSNEENIGLARSLNKGIEVAKGKYIMRMDADDICYEHRIEKQIRALERDKDVVAIGSNADIIDKDRNYIYTSEKALHWKEIKEVLPESPFIHPSVMFKRKETIEVGGYPEVSLSQDKFFFNLLAEKGKLVNLNESLLQYRIHPNSLSRKSKKTVALVNDSFNFFMQNNRISEKIESEIKKQRASESNNKNYYYHRLLSKKYLWNNYEAKKSREHAWQAIKSSSGIEYFEPILLFLISFMNESLIKRMYGVIKG